MCGKIGGIKGNGNKIRWKDLVKWSGMMAESMRAPIEITKNKGMGHFIGLTEENM